ncbi:hypothetical protein [Natrinema soli]|uniref:Uncharacterized protein n=1 Tax=Natrinema soli TaxID=1930624 RepID=A0ABD5SNX7_9EURY|nr:hypothetical protein [Natrinema soli]
MDEIPFITSRLVKLIDTHSPGAGSLSVYRCGEDDPFEATARRLRGRHQAVYDGEHNVTSYELVSIVSNGVGVGKSSSTKLTEEKISAAEFDDPVLLGVDELGLNDPDTLHIIQFINGLDEFVDSHGMSRNAAINFLVRESLWNR